LRAGCGKVPVQTILEESHEGKRGRGSAGIITGIN
jgi:hypothetical protein